MLVDDRNVHLIHIHCQVMECHAYHVVQILLDVLMALQGSVVQDLVTTSQLGLVQHVQIICSRLQQEIAFVICVPQMLQDVAVAHREYVKQVTVQ